MDYATLADLRYQVRRFLRVREELARAAGLEPQQHLLLLQLSSHFLSLKLLQLLLQYLMTK